MINIISESNDISTNKVIDWLYYFNEDFKRINTDIDYCELSLEINNEDKSSSLDNNVFWIRRGYFPFIKKEAKNTIYFEYLKNEYLLSVFFIENFSNKIIGSYYKEYHNNKLENLIFAKKAGLKIPNTILTNKKCELEKFIKKDKQYITKSISKSPYIKKNEILITGDGTCILDKVKIPEKFSMSLVQEYINKKFELRVFFIKDFFYSMAIFSQNDEKTKIDYRNYNLDKPNRCIPFELPNEIKSKLKKFAKISKHNTGSIDLIYSTENEYVFLEINPMGQFDWLSGNCNYNIEKKIAEILIYEKERK